VLVQCTSVKAKNPPLYSWATPLRPTGLLAGTGHSSQADLLAWLALWKNAICAP